jgi:hypothetical protein
MKAKVHNWDTNELVEISVGDVVGFKSDIEQSGVVTAIRQSYMGTVLTLESKWGFSGDYIGGDTVTTEEASDCWYIG